MSTAMVTFEGATIMSRISQSFRMILGERPSKTLMVRGIKSSVRLVKEARSLTEAIQHLLQGRPDVELVSEQGWRRQTHEPEREVALLVGSVAYLSGGLVLRLQLLDGRSFHVLDEVEAALGEDLAGARTKLADAVSILLSSDPGMHRHCRAWL